MPYYLTQASYSPEGWSSLVENPEDRGKAIAQTVEHAGGTFHGSWLPTVTMTSSGSMSCPTTCGWHPSLWRLERQER